MYILIQELTRVDISHNEIGKEGAQYLADALEKNTVMLILP